MSIDSRIPPGRFLDLNLSDLQVEQKSVVVISFGDVGGGLSGEILHDLRGQSACPWRVMVHQTCCVLFEICVYLSLCISHRNLDHFESVVNYFVLQAESAIDMILECLEGALGNVDGGGMDKNSKQMLMVDAGGHLCS